MKKIPRFDGLRDCIKIRGSCNGLICAVFPNGRIFLWNPTIGEALGLPNNNGDTAQKDASVLGLGYDSSIDDYKVFRAHHFPSLLNCEILALKSGTWRKVEKQEPETYSYRFFDDQGIFLRGALHWLAYNPKNIVVVLVFDIVEEKFSELVELPDNVDERAKACGWTHLMGSGDSLILGSKAFGCDHLEVWQLKEYGVKSSWTKIIRETSSVPKLFYLGNVLHYTKTGKILFEYEENQTLWFSLV